MAHVIGYFAQWGIYAGHDYFFPAHVKYEKLTGINYAFAHPQDDGTIQSIDTWADYNITWHHGKRVRDGSLVVGFDDLAPAGNLQSIRWYMGNNIAGLNLPATWNPSPNKNPNCKFILSLGGWNHSDHFSALAANPVSRATFAAEIVEWLRHGYHPDLQLNFVPGTSRPLFDGIDLDWEYPAVPGAAHTPYNPADTHNFTLMVQEIRNALDAASITDGVQYTMSMALGAGKVIIDAHEMLPVSTAMDFINVMTYDYHGVFDVPLLALHHSALNTNIDPNTEANCSFSINYVINSGVPASKINLGLPFYTRGVVGAANIGNIATGGAPGEWDDRGINAGINSLETAMNSFATSGFTLNRDVTAGNMPYLHQKAKGKDTLYFFDDTVSAQEKINFVNQNQLAGIFFWELSGDYKATGVAQTNFEKTAMVDLLGLELNNV